MFLNSIQNVVKLKKCKINKHMELGLYHKPIINFRGSKSNETSRDMYLKIFDL